MLKNKEKIKFDFIQGFSLVNSEYVIAMVNSLVSSEYVIAMVNSKVLLKVHSWNSTIGNDSNFK